MIEVILNKQYDVQEIKGFTLFTAPKKYEQISKNL